MSLLGTTGTRLGIGARIDTSPDVVKQHLPERIWPESNCYLDLWIEALERLGFDSRPACAAALAARTRCGQWSFVKPWPEDLLGLYGITVEEFSVWRPIDEHLVDMLQVGTTATIEVDAHWLPDTAGTTYRLGHEKTSILPVEFDRQAAELVYIHNSGCFTASGEDVAGLLSGSPEVTMVPLPYVEQVVLPEVCEPVQNSAVHERIQGHLLRADPNAMASLATAVIDALDWLSTAGDEGFHLWSFATLRSAGSTAEVCADLCDWLTEEGDCGAAVAAADLFRDCASTAKALQFRMSRIARGRAVDPRGSLETMADRWERGIGELRAAAG